MAKTRTRTVTKTRTRTRTRRTVRIDDLQKALEAVGAGELFRKIVAYLGLA